MRMEILFGSGQHPFVKSMLVTSASLLTYLLHNLFGTKLSTDVTATPVPGTNDLTALRGAGVALELIPEMLTLGQ